MTTLPGLLVQSDWLESHLSDEGLRILECTTILRPGPDGRLRAMSGREAWQQGHIPGSAFADLPGDLSDQSQRLRFMMPPADQFARAMSGYGVGEGSRVVLYDRAGGAWAARVWWMLRVMGFDDAAVLDGGWAKWSAEGRPTSSAASSYPEAAFTPRPRTGMFADRDEVLQAIDDRGSCIINALSPEQHAGEGAARYGRPGRIPGSVNVPSGHLLDPESNAYLPLETLREQFQAVGADQADRVITYCGGGIAASNDAFALTLLGYQNVAIYDASLSEWAADPELPMEVGPGQ